MGNAKDFLRRFNGEVAGPAEQQQEIECNPDQTALQASTSVTVNAFLKPSAPLTMPIMDGTAEKRGKSHKLKKQEPQISAIFVHAGAGYHSTTNEHLHLSACAKASRLAMTCLRSGGSAVDAVELAIRALEDNEITNAGYGSNLSIEGVVEGDATIVDHNGRSGACGAVAQIKNPIHLARTILDASSKPLSLRRVPPNLLVAQGATDFAYDHKIPVVPYDMVVSRSARERFVRWREDLNNAEGRVTPKSSNSSQAEEDLNHEYEASYQARQRRDHTNALLQGTFNEGQPDSPQQTPGPESPNYPRARTPTYLRTPSPNPSGYSTSSDSGAGPAKRLRYTHSPSDPYVRTHSLLGLNPGVSDYQKGQPNVALTLGELSKLAHTQPGTSDGPISPDCTTKAAGHLSFAQEGAAETPFKEYFGKLRTESEDDLITDTVGAIAIDCYGNIAAGSSSGGIGMKHRGRVGPAALVGVGTAVVPRDEYDVEGVAVAAVTSGTGEHMATTMASQKCADRLYHNTRRGLGGPDITATEDEAMESFIQADFMGHPGVRGSNSMGAIGVMAVKQTKRGYYVHFAHNTDSFALSSFHSNEREPKCTMSRLGTINSVTTGARKIRID